MQAPAASRAMAGSAAASRQLSKCPVRDHAIALPRAIQQQHRPALYIWRGLQLLIWITPAQNTVYLCLTVWRQTVRASVSLFL